VPWTPPSKRSCPTLAYIVIGGSGADSLSQHSRDRAVYRADAASLGVRTCASSSLFITTALPFIFVFIGT
jgi:hypothetical protein